MPQTITAFLAACDREGLKYREPYLTADGKTVVDLDIRSSGGSAFTVRYLFHPEGRDAAIRIFGLAAGRRDILPAMLHRCNLLNNRYRWVKFVVDDDLDLNLEADCILTPETAGSLCLEMLCRAARIAEDALPAIHSNYGLLNPDPGADRRG